MRVSLIAHTPEPERIVAAAARLCYSGEAAGKVAQELSAEKSRELVRSLAAMGHDSPMEHAVFTFVIEGVSRALLAQITRHRIASFSVQSQRYVQMDGFEYVTPPEVDGQPEAARLFGQEMRRQAQAYADIARSLEQKHREGLLAQGVEEGEARRRARAKAREDARFVLPNACATQMMVTMNARSLHNFFRLRCCARAQWEIRALADEMLRIVSAAAPVLFERAGPGCVAGPCGEGGMSCGEAAAVRERYAGIKGGAANG